MIEWNDEISDEMLAAFIDGNATAEEICIISNLQLSDDGLLLEVLEVVQDCGFAYSNLMEFEENSILETTCEELGLSNSLTDLDACLGYDEFISLPEAINEMNLNQNDIGESETFNNNDFNLF